MAYQVLALKYRPQTFDELIGQETITQTLKNAILQNRLHHAYLLTGPRGVGKTSLARIFAKALNCEQGPTVTPCQQCVPCREITESRSLDVQEIDGASHTSVDDIRILRENVRYTPGTGHYRIYIIDEVHMLSKSAFAALLKTLEEPPEHACFIFATTDPEKIPATILSRVLRFDFRRPSTQLLVEHLRRIVTAEGIEMEQEGLFFLARAAEGSVRDVLSLLDRMISFADRRIGSEQVLQVLGMTGHVAVARLLQLILAGETEAALQQVQELYENGSDLKQFGHELLEAIRNLLVYQLLSAQGLPDSSDQEVESVAALAKVCETADVEYLFHLFYRAYQEIVRSPLPKILLEITILRMCTRAKRTAISDVLSRLEGVSRPPGVSLQAMFHPPEADRQTGLEFDADTTKPSAAPAVAQSPAPQPTAAANADRTFAGFLKWVEKRKAPLASILARADFGGEREGRVELLYPDNPAYAEMLRDPDRQTLVFALGKEYFQKDIHWVDRQHPGAGLPATQQKAGASIVEEAVAIFQPRETRTSGRY